MPLPPLSVPCSDCDARKRALELAHFRVLGCDADPGKQGFCLIRYEDPLLGASATALHAPALSTLAANTAKPLAFAGKAAPLSQEKFDAVVASLKVEPAALWALMKVETSGCGFLPDRRPVILFERHKFHALTGGKFDAVEPDISDASPGGYLGGAGEYTRLTRAMACARDEALQSTSWGLGQIMGFNAKAAGYDGGVEEMVRAFVESEDAQIDAVVSFLDATHVVQPLRARNWQKVAQLYNGANYTKNAYDQKLAKWYAFYVARGLPQIRVRTAQLGLVLLGYAPWGSVDGVYGDRTDSALAEFILDEHLPPAAAGPGKLSDALFERIWERAGWL